MINTTSPVVVANASKVNKVRGTKFPHIPQWMLELLLKTCKEGGPKLDLPALGIYMFPVY